MVSESRDLTRTKSGTNPLDKVPMVLTFDVDSVNLVLEEMSKLSWWDLDILAIFAEVNHNAVFAKFGQELSNNLLLLLRDGGDLFSVFIGLNH